MGTTAKHISEAAKLKLEKRRLPWRPTKYREEFCQQVVQHCANGFSVSSFGAKCDVSWETISEWQEQYASFAEACKRARTACLAWWEERQVANASRGASGGQVAQVIFALKNFGAHEFRERIEHTGKDGAALALEVLLGKLDAEEKQAIQVPTIEHEPSSQLSLSSVAARASRENE